MKLNINFKVDVGSFTRGALQEGDSAKRRRLSGGRRWVPTITIVMDWEIFSHKAKKKSSDENMNSRDFDDPMPDWLTHNDGDEVRH